jgi:hypothetical protein
MHYAFTAIPDADVPRAADPTFQHVLQTYASETNKTASVWRAVPDDLLDFRRFEWVLPGHGQRVHLPANEMRAQVLGLAETMRGG